MFQFSLKLYLKYNLRLSFFKAYKKYFFTGCISMCNISSGLQSMIFIAHWNTAGKEVFYKKGYKALQERKVLNHILNRVLVKSEILTPSYNLEETYFYVIF